MFETEVRKTENVSKVANLMREGKHVGSFSSCYNNTNPYPVFTCNIVAGEQVEKLEVLAEYREFIKATLAEMGLAL